MEYLAADVLKLAGNAARDKNHSSSSPAGNPKRRGTEQAAVGCHLRTGRCPAKHLGRPLAQEDPEGRRQQQVDPLVLCLNKHTSRCRAWICADQAGLLCYNWSVRYVPATWDVWPYMTLQYACLPYCVPVCLSVCCLFVCPSVCLSVSVCTFTEIVSWNSGFFTLDQFRK